MIGITSRDQEMVRLNDQIRTLRREVADIDSKKHGLTEARQIRINRIARLEAQLAYGVPASVCTMTACT